MTARVLVSGKAEGPVLALSAPLSFWGGVDPASGRIISHGHPQLGQSVAGTMLTMTMAKGSSSSSSVLAETIRSGCGPAGIILGTPDPILTVGALVAARLYERTCPIIVVDKGHLARLNSAKTIGIIAADSTVVLCMDGKPV